MRFGVFYFLNGEYCENLVPGVSQTEAVNTAHVNFITGLPPLALAFAKLSFSVDFQIRFLFTFG